jgi:flagellar basal-body rod modification protein FlgD
MSAITSGIGSGTTSGSTPATVPGNLNLQPADFIKMMITQLQNQDPLQPTSNQDLLAQMSQIGQLQTSTQLQTVLTGLSLQTQIGSASSLIGKTVQGMDVNNNTIQGLVTSVKVQSDGVSLELDSGQSLSLSRVTSISPGPSGTTAGTPVAAA